jgi:hypothetical protein
LKLRGFPIHAIQRAIASGELRGGYIGNSTIISVSEEALDEWLENRRNGAPSKTAAASSVGGRQAPTPTSGAKVEWDAAVAQHMSRGLSRTAAIGRVDRERPGLRDRMLREHNDRQRV